MARRAFVRIVCLVVLAFGLVGCDHATKIAAKATLQGAAAVPIAPGVLHGAVELRYVENDDIAFSALRQLGVPRSPAMLACVSLVALAAIAITVIAHRRRLRAEGGPSEPDGRVARAGVVLVLGGAIGNVLDRIARGYVVDFIHVKGWPVFNVADIAVAVGMALVAIAGLRRRRREPPASAPS